MFIEARMPLGISYGCQGGPEFQTRIVTSGSGVEYRTARWSEIRSSWNVGYGIKTNAEFDALYRFFLSVKGRNYGFRFRDPRDNAVEVAQFGVGDGVERFFGLEKPYTTYLLDASPITVTRRICKPCPDEPLAIFKAGVELVDGVDYTVTYETGVVEFTIAPAAAAVLEWTGTFDLPARFDVDKLDATMVEFGVHDWPDVPVIELNPQEILA